MRSSRLGQGQPGKGGEALEVRGIVDRRGRHSEPTDLGQLRWRYLRSLREELHDCAEAARVDRRQLRLLQVRRGELGREELLKLHAQSELRPNYRPG